MQDRSSGYFPSARLALAFMAFLFGATAANAQISYVGPKGDDANPCTRAAAPCRSLQRGIDVAPAGGDVRVLGSGDYGSATITKSLTISGDGATVAVGWITINNAGAVVALRDLNIVGVGQNDNGGVYIVAASAVHIERCVISHFTTHGILATAPGVKLFVTGTILRDNGVAGLAMDYANASPSDHGTMTLTLDRSQVENNAADGVFIIGGASTFIRSSFTRNGASGINVVYGTGTLFSSKTTQNGNAGITTHQSSIMLESSNVQATGSVCSCIYRPSPPRTSHSRTTRYTASRIPARRCARGRTTRLPTIPTMSWAR